VLSFVGPAFLIRILLLRSAKKRYISPEKLWLKQYLEHGCFSSINRVRRNVIELRRRYSRLELDRATYTYISKAAREEVYSYQFGFPNPRHVHKEIRGSV